MGWNDRDVDFSTGGGYDNTPVWMIISAYNKRVNQIEELREDVEKLKKDQRRE